jgi:hypothetical protein
MVSQAHVCAGAYSGDRAYLSSNNRITANRNCQSEFYLPSVRILRLRTLLLIVEYRLDSATFCACRGDRRPVHTTDLTLLRLQCAPIHRKRLTAPVTVAKLLFLSISAGIDSYDWADYDAHGVLVLRSAGDLAAGAAAILVL